MTTAENTTTDFYKDKGKVRYTIILGDKQKFRLASVAEKYSLTQGEVIEVLLDKIDLSTMGKHLEAKRNEKIGSKITQTSLIKQMKNLTPQQLAAIAAVLEGGKDKGNEA